MKVFGDAAAVERLSERLKQARSLTEYRRIQCVLMRVGLGNGAKEIAQVLGWSVVTVYIFQSRWKREGDRVFEVGVRGGRRHEYLSEEEEKAFVESFVQRARAGNLVTVKEIRQAYEERIGRPVAPSTVYRLLSRHGWRKVVPRPRHPQADLVAQGAFKKTPPDRASGSDPAGQASSCGSPDVSRRRAFWPVGFATALLGAEADPSGSGGSSGAKIPVCL